MINKSIFNADYASKIMDRIYCGGKNADLIKITEKERAHNFHSDLVIFACRNNNSEDVYYYAALVNKYLNYIMRILDFGTNAIDIINTTNVKVQLLKEETGAGRDIIIIKDVINDYDKFDFMNLLDNSFKVEKSYIDIINQYHPITI